MRDDSFLLADFTGRKNWPTLSIVWHPLNSQYYARWYKAFN